jgi:dTDP-4-amino-4,6-dideoxygalactose transaminase
MPLKWQREDRLKIYFKEEDIDEYMDCVKDIVANNRWSEGKYTVKFEEICSEEFGLRSVAVTNAGAALYLLYQYAGVAGKDVIVPGNTCWPTVAAAKLAGANIIYADCNQEDLCLNYEDMIRKVTDQTAAITVVHVGGHIAFEIEKIAKFCKERKIALIEDCAHAHGASWNGKKPGSWGIGGAYSFYATKTVTTGEGGMVVTNSEDIETFCKRQRNYGKEMVDNKLRFALYNGFNFRISEFTAALGWIQMKNLPEILKEKRALAKKYDQIFKNRIIFPEGMVSGYYKYIAFDQKLKQQVGKVFSEDDQCCNIEETDVILENCNWVARHHVCPPIYNGVEFCEEDPDTIRRILFDD